MKKIIIIIFLFTSLNNCGFKIAENKELKGYLISKIDTYGEGRINYQIKNLLNTKSEANSEKKLKITLNTKKEKKVKEKNINNEITKYQMNVTTNVVFENISQKLSDDIHLIVLGTGPEEKKIKDIVKNRKNIHFFGYQNKEKTISLIRGSDILIQPSLNEGISSTILEAMACKTIVITTNVGGNKELIINEETGFLLSINSDLFIEKINYIFTHQTKLEKIINNAFRFAQQYDWNEVGKKYLKLYEKLLD